MEVSLENDEVDSNCSKKKRRKKPSLTTYNNKKYASSKSFINLPSNLSDYSWIENSDFNKVILEEEKIKFLELKR